LFGTAQRQHEANDAGDDAADEQPDGFVGRRAGEKSGDVGPEGVCSIDSYDHEHNTANEQGKRKGFIHNGLSVSLCFVARLIRVLHDQESRHPPATGDEIDKYHDDGNDQQDVNKRTYRVAGDQT
jgi:hypothetical protein